MALGLLPILALFGGAIVIAGGKKKKSPATASKSRGCSPADVFGIDYAPIGEVVGRPGFEQGGYPEYASAFVAKWIADNPQSWTANYLKNDKQWATSWRKALGDAQEGSQMEEVQLDGDIRIEDSIPSVWKAAHEICESIGCGSPPSSDNRISSIISNDREWLKWVIAAGVYINLPIVNEIPWSGGPGIRAATFFGLSIGGFRELGIDDGAEETAFARVIAEMTKVKSSTVQYIRSRIQSRNSEWLFGSLLEGAQPWNDYEKKVISTVEDVFYLFTGSRDTSMESRPAESNFWHLVTATTTWFEIDVFGHPARTDSGKYISTESMRGALGTGPYSGIMDANTISAGLSPVFGVRTYEGWWENEGRKNVEEWLSLNPDLDSDAEGLAIAALLSDSAVPLKKEYSHCLPGNNWLMKNFPRPCKDGSAAFGGGWSDFEDYARKFEKEDPLAFYAVLNVVTFIGDMAGINFGEELLDATE